MTIPLSPLQVIAAAGTLIALLLGFVALATPAWQVNRSDDSVVYAREIDQWIQSGLWLNCLTRPSGMYTCTYTFSASDFNFYTSADVVNIRTPPFYAWQRTLLAVLLFGQLFAFLTLISIFLSFQPSTRRLSAIAFIALMAIAVLLHSGALTAFALISQMVEYRFYTVSVSGIYEKRKGYSFYVGLVALMIYAFVALPFGVFHLLKSGRERDRTKVPTDVRGMIDNFDREPYAQFYPPSSSGSQQHQALHSNSTTHSILDPYESQFAMRALPDVPRWEVSR